MIEKIIVVLIIILLVFIGFVIKKITCKKILNKEQECVEYHNKLIELIDSKMKGNMNTEMYYYLTENVNEMQIELGCDGIIANYIDNLRGLSYSDYPVLINFLPKILSENHMYNSISRERFLIEAQSCADGFIRHSGTLKKIIKQLKKEYKNPIFCFVEGVKIILIFPLYLLKSFGLLSINIYNKILKNLIVKSVISIIAFAGFLSSIITIILGWEQTLEIIKKIFKL